MTRLTVVWLFVSRGAIYGLVGGAVAGAAAVYFLGLLALLSMATNPEHGKEYLRLTVTLGAGIGACVGFVTGRREGKHACRLAFAGAISGGILGLGPTAILGVMLFTCLSVAGAIYGVPAGGLAGLVTGCIVSALVAARHYPLADRAACRREATVISTLAGALLAGPAMVVIWEPEAIGWPTANGMILLGIFGALGAICSWWAGRRTVEWYIESARVAT